jgi:hypothetical protein
MRARLAPILAGLVLMTATATARQDSCATTCHGQEETSFRVSVHAEELTCVDCHGGDATALRDKQASHAASAGFRGTPDRAAIPELCGSCHSDPLAMFAYDLPTDQLVHYQTSKHGQALFERGDPNVAVCSDCHGSHGVLKATDPKAPTNRANQPAMCGACHSDAERMAPYGLPTDIVEQFHDSVHGRALRDEQSRGAPACVDCHGSHGISPPGVESIVHVCGHCHATTGEHFRRSPHFGAEEMTCTACHEEAPGYLRSNCSACHGAHAIAEPGPWMFAGDEPGRCQHCHRDDDRAAAVAATIVDGTQRLETSMQTTLDRIQEAKASGLFLQNEQIYLRESRRALISLKPLAHSLDEQAIRAQVEDGIKRQDRALEMVERKRLVLRDRKILVGGVVLVLLMLVGLLAVKLDAVRKLS